MKYPLVNIQKAMGRFTMLLMGKSTISMPSNSCPASPWSPSSGFPPSTASPGSFASIPRSSATPAVAIAGPCVASCHPANLVADEAGLLGDINEGSKLTSLG